MSHYLAYVVIPADGDVDELVGEALAPYDENRELPGSDDGYNPHGIWDWWQIGGRWTGHLSGYDPHNDPALLETWPTQRPRHDGDIVDALDVAARIGEIPTPYTIFTHGSESVTQKEEWTGEEFVHRHDEEGMRAVLATILSARIAAGLKDRVVVVDYHS